MPIPITPKPAFPNVPQSLGVPPVPRAPGIQIPAANFTLAVSDFAGLISLFAGPQWGLFTSDGMPAFSALAGLGLTGPLGGIITTVVSSAAQLAGIAGQSIGSAEFRNDNRISTAPQEEGAFLSYNKVSSPFNARVTYIISGLPPFRSAFLAACKAMLNSLQLLTFVMPEYSWPSCNMIHYDLRRSARDGVSMFAVDIWVEEVRVTGTAAFTNTQAPAGAAGINGGTVQPAIPAPAQTPPATSSGRFLQ
jgi:hypothetical protein